MKFVLINFTSGCKITGCEMPISGKMGVNI